MAVSFNYREFFVEFVPDVGGGHVVSVYLEDYKWVTFLSHDTLHAQTRAVEAIDSEAGRDIIEFMKVTKEHTLQVGDVVTIVPEVSKRVGRGNLGIVESTLLGEAWVGHVKLENGYYTKSNEEVCYQLEEVRLLPNREKWVQIKKDIDRGIDGAILQGWIENK